MKEFILKGRRLLTRFRESRSHKDTPERTLSMQEGSYLLRHGRFVPVSDEDSEHVFRMTCLFGVLGWLEFHQGKPLQGILYVLSCGSFGIGWVFDVLSFLLGTAKDQNDRYYAPLPDKKTALLSLAAVIVAAVLLLFAYRELLVAINLGVSKILVQSSLLANKGL